MTNVGTTVPELLARRVAQTPAAHAFACVDPGRPAAPVSWEEFAAATRRLAGALQALGLRAGDRFAILLMPCVEWELLHHAALSIGAVVVGLDAHDLPERLASMVEAADIVAFAVPHVQVLRALGPDRLRKLRFVIDVSGEGSLPEGKKISWNELESMGVAYAGPGPGPGDMATIVFTSGTTGEPKAIPYRHEQMCEVIHTIGHSFSFIGADGRLLCWLPLSNLFQRMVNLVGLRNGATTYLLSDPRNVMAAVQTATPDIFIGVPRFFEKLYDGIRERIAEQPAWQGRLVDSAWDLGRKVSQLRLEGKPVPSVMRAIHGLADALVLRRIRSVMGNRLQLMVTGSAPTPMPLLREFHALGWLVLEAYGLSENIMPMAMNLLDGHRLGSVGRPFGGNQIRIDPEGGIQVRSACLAAPAGGLPGTPVDREGYYDTGDLGSLDEAGYLTLTGRRNEMFKTSTGRRVSPHPAEAALRQVRGVEQAILIGAGRKVPVALCWAGSYLGGGPDLEKQLVRAANQVAPHERPQAIGVIDTPFTIETGELTPNLKLRRAEIERLRADAIERVYRALEGRSAPPAGGTLVVWPQRAADP